MSESYRIGEIARLSNVSVPTVRYYERLGLLPKAPRTSGGNRRYTHDAIERIQFVKRAQNNGLTLAEIGELISLKHRGGARRCKQVQQLLAAKISELDKQRAQLDEFRRTLQAFADECAESLRRGSDSDCLVIAKI
jgi:MerR family mercuric resistance operon transcriptional regulator